VSVIGPSDPFRRQALERQLIWATPGQRGFQDSRVSQITPEEATKAAQLSEIMNNMAQLDDTARRETLLNSLCGEDVLELPFHESPPSVESGFLNADLLKHQV
jgi:SWI/SNF-related matrix-associated actin-dependent regulator of chromatin subfamily A3